MENPEDSDGDEYKQPYDGASGAGGASTGGGSYNVQLGPDGAAMTMTNPDELVDVDLFLEVMLEELADADVPLDDEPTAMDDEQPEPPVLSQLAENSEPMAMVPMWKRQAGQALVVGVWVGLRERVDGGAMHTGERQLDGGEHAP